MCVVPGGIVVLIAEGFVEEEADDSFVDAVEREEVGFFGVVRSPDGDAVDEMGVCKGVVEADEYVCGKEFVDVFEGVYEGM